MRRPGGGPWASVAILAVLLVAWELAAAARLVDPDVVSRPRDVLAAARVAFGSSEIFLDTAITFVSVSIGLGAGVAIGVPAGIAIGLVREVRWACEWWFLVMNSLPRFALAPILIVALGLGLVSKSTVAFLGSVIPIALLVAAGVREIPPQVFRVAAGFRLTRSQVLSKIVLPGTMPHIMAGTQLGFSRALASVIVAEMYNPRSGLGRWIAIGQTSLDTSQLVFASILVAVVGALFVHGFTVSERRLVRWRA